MLVAQSYGHQWAETRRGCLCIWQASCVFGVVFGQEKEEDASMAGRILTYLSIISYGLTLMWVSMNFFLAH